MNDINDLDDSEIPESSFTGPAPKRPEKESGKGGNRPDGPACPVCKKDERGVVHTWKNATRKGHPYYRCSKCKGCWWPDRDDMRKIDVKAKWPLFEKEKQQ